MGLLLGFFLRGDGGLEAGASLECRNGGGRDLEHFAGLRVLAGTGGAFAGLEGAEADQGDVVALGDLGGDDLDDGINGLASGSFGDFGLGGQASISSDLFMWWLLPLVGKRGFCHRSIFLHK